MYRWELLELTSSGMAKETLPTAIESAWLDDSMT